MLFAPDRKKLHWLYRHNAQLQKQRFIEPNKLARIINYEPGRILGTKHKPRSVPLICIGSASCISESVLQMPFKQIPSGLIPLLKKLLTRIRLFGSNGAGLLGRRY